MRLRHSFYCAVYRPHKATHQARFGAPALFHSLRQHVSSQLAIPQSQKPSPMVCTTHGHLARTPLPHGHGLVSCCEACVQKTSDGRGSSSGNDSWNRRRANLHLTRASSYCSSSSSNSCPSGPGENCSTREAAPTASAASRELMRNFGLSSEGTHGDRAGSHG